MSEAIRAGPAGAGAVARPPFAGLAPVARVDEGREAELAGENVSRLGVHQDRGGVGVFLAHGANCPAIVPDLDPGAGSGRALVLLLRSRHGLRGAGLLLGRRSVIVVAALVGQLAGRGAAGWRVCGILALDLECRAWRVVDSGHIAGAQQTIAGRQGRGHGHEAFGYANTGIVARRVDAKGRAFHHGGEKGRLDAEILELGRALLHLVDC